MCLGIPGEILSIAEDAEHLRTAKVRFGGATRDVYLELVPDARVGDYVIVHVGYALTKLDPDEAARTLALMAEAGLVDAAGGAATVLAAAPAADDCEPPEGDPTNRIVGPASAGQPAAGGGAE